MDYRIVWFIQHLDKLLVVRILHFVCLSMSPLPLQCTSLFLLIPLPLTLTPLQSPCHPFSLPSLLHHLAVLIPSPYTLSCSSLPIVPLSPKKKVT